ncbi:hypothetical protein Ancab_004570 [Ancistrocladus abbreviatus]
MFSSRGVGYEWLCPYPVIWGVIKHFEFKKSQQTKMKKLPLIHLSDDNCPAPDRFSSRWTDRFSSLFFTVSVIVSADVDLFGGNVRPGRPPPSTSRPTQPTHIIDHYILAVTWPWGFCNTSVCSSNTVPVHFTIHGLWPVGPPLPGQKATAANSLHYCKNGQPLDKKITQSQSLVFQTYWPNVTTMQKADSEKFWEHEYIKHGRCCVPPLTQKQYFERPIELLRNYHISEQLLGNGNVLPGRHTKVSQIMNSFSGRLPAVHYNSSTAPIFTKLAVHVGKAQELLMYTSDSHATAN